MAAWKRLRLTYERSIIDGSRWGEYSTRSSACSELQTTRYTTIMWLGPDTELGQISTSLRETGEEKTPLQEKLDELGHKLVPIFLVVAAIVLVSGWLRGQDLFLMVETAISLSIATVPEGLPIVATLVLARRMWRMADRNTLISNLASVETLGSTTVICTDKTGTLAENDMTAAAGRLRAETTVRDCQASSYTRSNRSSLGGNS